MHTGEVTLYIATSVDGFVATADGGVEWLEQFEGEGETAAAYEAFVAGVDALAMGATTYDQVCSFGDWPYGETPTYVFARDERDRAAESVAFVAGDVRTVAERITGDHDHVWLVGGPDLARSFLRHGLVDALRVTVLPVFLGSGVPLFRSDPAAEPSRLDLVGDRSLGAGIVERHYRFVA